MFQPTKMVGDDNKDVKSKQVLPTTVQERLISYNTFMASYNVW